MKGVIMINAKKEFLEEVKSKDVLCAKITIDLDYCNSRRCYILRSGYSETEINQFLQSLDFEYDCGYGNQELDGHIWYKNGTWSERSEYDGSEWWEHKSYPPVPEECSQLQNDSKDD